MKAGLKQLWIEEDGLLAFEWTLLLTVLVIGIVSGVAAVRDGIIDELGDIAQMMLAVDQSYTVSFPLNVDVHTVDGTSSSDSSFTDALIYTDCDRDITLAGQNVGPIDDFDS
jgi:Flp pilus assembly pilin Flp